MENSRQIPRDDLTELPLFPLNLVLFPGMLLPLHIFEERYKAMIGDCIERDAPFGVALIKEGPEVGGLADTFRIGSTARIRQVQRLDEGRLNLLTQGEQRFELVEVIQQTPHLIGLVSFKAEETGDVPPSLTAEATEEYTAFLRQVSALSGSWNAPAPPPAPADPISLSFEAVAALTGSVDLPQGMRQDLLEIDSAKERLEKLLPLLKRSNQLIQEQVEKNNTYRGPRLN